MTLQQYFEAKLAAIKESAAQETAKVEAEMVSVGPFLEHEMESLKQWIASAASHLGI